MRHLIFGLGILFSFGGLSQDVSRFVEKTVGEGYVQLPKNLAATKDSVLPVYSRCVKDVVIGHVFKGEYVLHDDSLTALNSKETLIGTSNISRGEFLEFRNWIQDSIAREKMYFDLSWEESQKQQSKRINFRKQEDLEYVEFEPDNNSTQEEIVHLNWDKKFRYDNPDLIPVLADMYYPQPQLFRKRRDIDLRKMFYESISESKKTRNTYPIFIDSYNWALGEQRNFSAKTVLAFLDDQLYLDAPITNIEPFMAVAYCEWKSKELTKLLGSENHRIECRLPNVAEVEYAQKSERPTIEIPAYDHTDDWQITNNEYHAFSTYVLDSLQREYVYYKLEEDEEALSLLKYQKRYFDEGALEFIDVNPRFREENRWYFNLDFKKKLETKDPTYAALLSEFSDRYRDTIPFRYWWMDAIDRSVKGKLIPDPDQKRTEYGHYLVLTPKARTDNEPHGEDLVLEGWRGLDGFGTRDHANLQRFIHREIVALPLPNAIPSNEEIADISYEQALAFYNWKFRIDKYKEDETGDWQQFVFPTEAEFERIKNGERILHPATSIAYDFPVFRMVVELVPR